MKTIAKRKYKGLHTAKYPNIVEQKIETLCKELFYDYPEIQRITVDITYKIVYKVKTDE